MSCPLVLYKGDTWYRGAWSSAKTPANSGRSGEATTRIGGVGDGLGYGGYTWRSTHRPGKWLTKVQQARAGDPFAAVSAGRDSNEVSMRLCR